MSYALVGSLGAVATGTAPAAAFGQATTSGNLLIAWITSADTSAAVSVTGTGWAQASGISSNAAQVWYRPNCGAAEAAPAFTCANAINVMLGEFSGGATTSPVDQAVNQTGSASPTTFTTPGADAAAAELVICAAYILLSKAGTDTTSHTYNNGASATGNVNNDATSIVRHYRLSYGITTGNAAADSVEVADTSMNFSSMRCAVASFKLAAGGPTPLARPINTELQAVARGSLW